MKKVLVFLLIVILVFSVTACGSQPAVESSSETVTTTSQDITSIDTATTTSNATTTSTPTTTTTSPKPSSNVTTTSTAPPIRNPATVTSVPTYTGDYLEDVTVGDLKWDYDNLKTNLQNYIANREPTRISGKSKIYDLSSDPENYSLLGYVSDNFDETDIHIAVNADGEITAFNLSVTAAYKTPEFAAACVKTDFEKLKVFTKDAEVNYFIAFEYGNPDDYKTFEALSATKDADKIYKGTNPSAFVSLHYLNEDKSLKTLLTVNCKNDNGILKFTSKVQVYY